MIFKCHTHNKTSPKIDKNHKSYNAPQAPRARVKTLLSKIENIENIYIYQSTIMELEGKKSSSGNIKM